MSILHFSAMDLFRIGFIASLSLLIVFAYFITRKTEEKSQLQNLETQLKIKQGQLNAMQEQKARVESLLNHEATRLENHLRTLKKQEEGIRKLLGEKSKIQNGSRSKLKGKNAMAYRFGAQSSRGGSSYSLLVMRLASVQEQIGQEERGLARTRRAALVRHVELEHIPSIWPVGGEVTSGFGYRSNPLGRGTEFHEGVDIGADYGAPIHATASGTCVYSGWEEGFGYTVKIDHSNGLVTQYSHCSDVKVRVGEEVSKGEVVANIGDTGFSTGCHLHYEVLLDGQPVNPARYLPGY